MPAARRLTRLDVGLYRRIRGCASGSALTPPVRVFSRTGEHAGLWLALGAGGALIDRPRRARWWRAVLAIVLTNTLTTAIKLVVRRPRPAFEDLPALAPTKTQLSFPSAHAATSFAAAGAYAGLLPRGPLLAAATIMAGSRVYLGVHYPSDVVAGALLGTSLGGVTR